jgi:TPR repeat protein
MRKVSIVFLIASFSAVVVSAQKPGDFEAKALQGDAEAQYRLGHCYDYGEGVNADYSIAFQWYEKAAKQGHADATAEVGGFYYNGYVVEKDYNKAIALFREAERKGSPHAQYLVGRLL